MYEYSRVDFSWKYITQQGSKVSYVYTRAAKRPEDKHSSICSHVAYIIFLNRCSENGNFLFKITIYFFTSPVFFLNREKKLPLNLEVKVVSLPVRSLVLPFHFRYEIMHFVPFEQWWSRLFSEHLLRKNNFLLFLSTK